MSQAKALLGQVSPETGKRYSTELILKAFGIPSSTFYDSLATKEQKGHKKRGPKTEQSDDEIARMAREVLNESPFSGEGHRKVRAMLAIRGIHVGKNRILRIMRQNKLLAPTRNCRKGTKKVHDGKITTSTPNECWGGDITEVMTQDDGKVYIFDLIDHCTSEVLAAYVTTVGNRFSAITSLHQAINSECGPVSKDVARGITLRLDHGSQFTSKRYVNEAKHLGFNLSYSYVAQPQCNGVIERWHRTLKEQLLWTKSWKNLEEVQESVQAFVETYNEHWMLEKHGYLSPRGFKRSLADAIAA
ncbi:MAG: IS3 family transposase [Gammaproteobacteria bacterium]|nr:IS3 family transposase [Gammaproteobacteria bacterium]